MGSDNPENNVNPKANIIAESWNIVIDSSVYINFGLIVAFPLYICAIASTPIAAALIL